MTTRRVLFVGGVADGQWHEISAEHSYYRFPLPLGPVGVTEPQAYDALRTHDYRIERVVILTGRCVWVAVFDIHGADREVAVIRALFQRDVAAELTGTRRAR